MHAKYILDLVWIYTCSQNTSNLIIRMKNLKVVDHHRVTFSFHKIGVEVIKKMYHVYDLVKNSGEETSTDPTN